MSADTAGAVEMMHSRTLLLSETLAVSAVQHAKRLQHVAADQERQLEGLREKAVKVAEAAEAHEQQLKRSATAHRPANVWQPDGCRVVDEADCHASWCCHSLLNDLHPAAAATVALWHCSAAELHSNLDARFQLLASLHWSLPHQMSAAESTLLASDLPALERIAADLKRKCQVHCFDAQSPVQGAAHQQCSIAAV
jgi:hypothetical protein